MYAGYSQIMKCKGREDTQKSSRSTVPFRTRLELFLIKSNCQYTVSTIIKHEGKLQSNKLKKQKYSKYSKLTSGKIGVWF